MFVKKLLSFLMCVPFFASAMELEQWPYMPEEMHYTIIKDTDLLTKLNFGAASKYHHEKYTVAAWVLNSPDMWATLTPSQHRFLLVRFAQQNNEPMFDYVIKNENSICAYHRLRTHNHHSHYHKGILGDKVSDFMMIYNGTMPKDSSMEACAFGTIVTHNSYTLGICLQNGLSVNHKDSEGCSLLMNCCSALSVGTVKLLLASGCNVNASDKGRTTALHVLAKKSNSSEIVPILNGILDKNVNIDAQTEHGSTPLHIAIEYNNKYMIEQLLNANADTSLRNSYGKTPLDCATEQERGWLLSLVEEKWSRKVTQSGDGVAITLSKKNNKRKRAASEHDNGDERSSKRSRK